MATEAITRKRLTERFNKYAEYRKEVERSGSRKSFTEELASLDERPQQKLAPLRPLRAGRRSAPPQLARPKDISSEQAKHLAQYAPEIQKAAAKYNVPVELICGVILQESGGNPRAVSPTGARGLMQLMPQTAKRFGVQDSFDASQNIDGGTRYLRFLLDRFDGNIELTLAGYNAGEHAVERHGNKVPPYRETRAYIPNVLGYTQSMINILATAQIDRSDALPAHARRA